jgi:hypothetical protein
MNVNKCWPIDGLPEESVRTAHDFVFKAISAPIPPQATPYCTEKSASGLKSRLAARRLDYRSDIAVFKCSVDALGGF